MMASGCATDTGVSASCAQQISATTFNVGGRRLSASIVDVEEHPAPPSGYSGFFGGVQLADGGFLAIGFDDAAHEGEFEAGAVWRSDEGTEWARIATEVTRPDGQQVTSSIIEVPGAVVLAGTTIYDQDRFEVLDGQPQVWRSTDGGRTFIADDLGEYSGTLAALATTDGILIAGGATGPGQTEYRPMVWVSTDNGVTWQRSGFDGDLGGAIRALTVTDSGDVIAAGFRLTAAGKMVGAVWRSEDNARSWSAEALPNVQDDRDWGFNTVMAAETGLVATGIYQVDNAFGDNTDPVSYIQVDDDWERATFDFDGAMVLAPVKVGSTVMGLATDYSYDGPQVSRIAVLRAASAEWTLLPLVNEDNDIEQLQAVIPVGDELWLMGRIDKDSGDLAIEILTPEPDSC
jgi:hypothetical protein